MRSKAGMAYYHASLRSCALCPASTYTEAGASNITGCLPCDGQGMYSPAGAGYCSVVGPGTYPNAFRNLTLPCPANTFSVGANNTCTNCGSGHSRPGASFCEKCDTGTYYDLPSNACVGCPSGKFSTSGAQNLEGCKNCEPGFASTATGAGYCAACAGGKHSSPDQSACANCFAGTYSGVAASSCVECESGKFTDSPASDQCQNCPLHKDSTAGSVICECKGTFFTVDNGACSCLPGFTIENGVCVACAPGFFKNATSTESCKKCNSPEHGVGIKGSVTTLTPATSFLNCSCSPREFRVLKPPAEEGFQGECLPCPVGTDCSTGSVTVETMPLEAGFWRSGKLSHNLVECFTKDACTRQNRTLGDELADANEQCSEGHLGPQCSVCEDGYAKSVAGLCEACDYETSIPAEIYALIVAILIGVVCVSTCMKRRSKKKKEKRRGERLEDDAPVTTRKRRKHRIERARTKFKILASFYQIVSQFASVLNVRYPPAFEQFTGVISKFVNLDALNLTKVGCLMRTNFYHKLLTSTLAPICISVAIAVFARVMMRRAKDHDHEQRVVDGAFALFLSLTYMVFASVSTTIFDTFNCSTFGDDETEYMMSDQSVNCGTTEHLMYKTYAGAMMFVYPIGVPVLYFLLLYKNKEKLREEGREEDESLHKIAFLWESYEPRVWWFEVFDCVRRLSLTGLLVFVFKGQASQVVVAMVLASLSVVAFVHWRPFNKEENDNLAIVSQGAIFFTLLAGLLKKVEVDKADQYDEDMFGMVLIFVNCVGVFMVIVGWLLKPISRLSKTMMEKHVHDAPLKGVTEEHAEWEKFEGYFRELVESGEEEAAWEAIKLGDWGKNKKESAMWLEETRLDAMWRSGHGDGPRDQAKSVFEVDHELEEVFEWLTSFGKPEGTTIENHPVCIYGDGVADVYFAVNLPWPLSPRDFLLERHCWVRGDVAQVLVRSKEDSAAGLKRSAHQGRVRAKVEIVGYYLERVAGGKTKVVFVFEIDLKGVMEMDIVNKQAAIERIRGEVNSMRLLGKQVVEAVDEEAGRGGFMARQLRAISSGVGLGSSFSRKNEGGRHWADEDLPAPPPPPEGPAPTWDNNVFTNGKARAAPDFEMRSNPMHGGGAEETVKAEKNSRHLDRMMSGGFGAKKKNEKPKELDRSLSSFQRSLKPEEEKAEELKSDWTKLADPDTGDPYSVLGERRDGRD